MNSEREAFEEVFTSSKGWDLTLINGVYQNQNTNNAYAGWKASANRKGYKLVPVDDLKHIRVLNKNAGEADEKYLKEINNTLGRIVNEMIEGNNE